jgi:Na+-transporting NADH:ubiquinone oxidoreductase subunit A
LAVDGRGQDFQKGLDVLNQMTDGKVFLGLNAKGSPAQEFTNATGVEKKWFHGKHPAGNVGVQIHHTAPLAVGDVVWYMDVQNVLTLGHLFNTGEWNQTKVVAVTGEPVSERGYVKTFAGARIADLVGNTSAEGNRFVAGDVLTGSNQGKAGFLGMNDDQVTVLTEGDKYEMFGWLLPKLNPTASRTLPSKLFPSLKFSAETNTHGEGRAFVVTGQYESVLPMDVYVQPLMKAILANDYERMEGLGLLELSEEDVALCEFACTSKQPLQKILRDGLEMMRDQV